MNELHCCFFDWENFASIPYNVWFNRSTSPFAYITKKLVFVTIILFCKASIMEHI